MGPKEDGPNKDMLRNSGLHQGEIRVPLRGAGQAGRRGGQGERREGLARKAAGGNLAARRAFPRRAGAQMLSDRRRLLDESRVREGAEDLQAALEDRGMLPLPQGRDGHGGGDGQKPERDELDPSRSLRRDGLPLQIRGASDARLLAMQAGVQIIRARDDG